MPQAPFHLAWFLEGSSVHGWNHPWSGAIGRDWRKPDLFIDLARSLERACFDYVLIEDSSYVGESFEGKRDIYLERGISVPRQDPSVVATLLANATRQIGIVPTFGTFAYPPFLLARLVSTLDQVSDGRIGWNMVTGSSDFAARNFGLPAMPEHDLRYEMAEEYMAAVNGLWDSWDADAVIADAASGRLVNPARVRSVDFEGQWYKSRGPLNSGPAPQGRPVIAQAGGSARGRQFAAAHADTIVAMAKGTEAMRAYRDDVRARMRALGRNPDDCKVLFLVSPILGATDAEAEAEEQRRAEQAAADASTFLAFFGKITNIDFGGFDLDTPVSRLELRTNGHQQTLDEFRRFAGDRSLRQSMAAFTQSGKSLRLVGSPERIADEMEAAMAAVGGDGFLISLPAITRRAVAEIADGLIPVLQARGLVRREYRHAQFRDNLRAF